MDIIYSKQSYIYTHGHAYGAETWRIFRMTANTTTAQDVPRSTRHGAERHWSLMGNRIAVPRSAPYPSVRTGRVVTMHSTVPSLL